MRVLQWTTQITIDFDYDSSKRLERIRYNVDCNSDPLSNREAIEMIINMGLDAYDKQCDEYKKENEELTQLLANANSGGDVF